MFEKGSTSVFYDEDMEESFRSLSFLGFDLYYVGTNGTVLSCRRSDCVVLKARKVNKYGHSQVRLYTKHSKSGDMAVHRLVLLAFVGPCPEEMECCHNDGNASNNRLENLRWDTHRNNSQDRRLHGTLVFGTKQWKCRVNEDVVRQIRKLWATGKYTHRQIGEKVGTSKDHVYSVLSGRVWKWVK